MSSVLLHITRGWCQSNHRLTCVPGNPSHPGYLKPCLPGPVCCESSWEVCHINRVPVKRQIKAARKVQPGFKCTMALLVLAGKNQTEGQERAGSGRACRAAAAAAQRSAFSWGRGGMWDGSFLQHPPALGTSSLPVPRAPRCLRGHVRMFA